MPEISHELKVFLVGMLVGAILTMAACVILALNWYNGIEVGLERAKKEQEEKESLRRAVLDNYLEQQELDAKKSNIEKSL